MKKFVNVLDERKAEYLENLGFKCRSEIVSINGKDKEIYIFIEDDKLFKILNDKKMFSKKDYYYSNIMKFWWKTEKGAI